jgi:hypothetical protein
MASTYLGTALEHVGERVRLRLQLFSCTVIMSN